MSKLVFKPGRLFSKHSATVLTILGSAGVVMTAISAAKETPKYILLLEEAEEEKGDALSTLEQVKLASPVYFPTAVLGISTIACVCGSNFLNKKAQESLASAYALVSKSFGEYRRKLIELHGEETDQEIRDAITREHCNYHQINADIPDRKMLFYEPISNKYIERYEKEIMDAEYHTNRNFVLRGYSPLNEFYEFLGLPQTADGEKLGWTCTDGECWIDFEHHPFTNNRGTQCYELTSMIPPDDDYMRDWT